MLLLTERFLTMLLEERHQWSYTLLHHSIDIDERHAQ
jgi:hypothetical protein